MPVGGVVGAVERDVVVSWCLSAVYPYPNDSIISRFSHPDIVCRSAERKGEVTTHTSDHDLGLEISLDEPVYGLPEFGIAALVREVPGVDQDVAFGELEAAVGGVGGVRVGDADDAGFARFRCGGCSVHVHGGLGREYIGWRWCDA